MTTERDIELITACIELKWESKLLGMQGRTCSLCGKYIKVVNDKIICNGCPIYKDTGKTNCIGTPYPNWGELKSFLTLNKIYELHAEVTAACQMEIDYLKGLRDRLKANTEAKSI